MQVNDYPVAVQHLNDTTGNDPYRIMIAYGGWTTCGHRVLVIIHADFLYCYIRNKTPQVYVIIIFTAAHFKMLKICLLYITVFCQC